MDLHIASMDALLYNIDALLYNMDALLSFIDLQRATPIYKASVLQSTLFKFFRKNDEKDKDTKKGH